MQFKKIPGAQAEALLTGAKGKSHPLRLALLDMMPGDVILVPKSTWKWKTSSPVKLIYRFAKDTGLRFSCLKLKNDEGWIIQRTDKLGNEAAHTYLALYKNSIRMSQKIPVAVRAYKFSDGRLEQICDEKTTCLERDLPELSTRGVTQPKIDAFTEKVLGFKDLPDDEEWEGDVTIAAQAKDKAAELCAGYCSTIRTMAENTWSSNSGNYRSFDFDGVNSKSDSDRIRDYRRICRRATKFENELAGEGLTAAFIASFEASITDYDSKLDALHDMQDDRDVATEQRILLGNDIYHTLVKFCNTGKDYWGGKSEAKYNDYVIYNTSTGLPDESEAGNGAETGTGTPPANG